MATWPPPQWCARRTWTVKRVSGQPPEPRPAPVHGLRPQGSFPFLQQLPTASASHLPLLCSPPPRALRLDQRRPLHQEAWPRTRGSDPWAGAVLPWQPVEPTGRGLWPRLGVGLDLAVAVPGGTCSGHLDPGSALLGSPSGGCFLPPTHKDRGRVGLWLGLQHFQGRSGWMGPAVVMFSVLGEVTVTALLS